MIPAPCKIMTAPLDPYLGNGAAMRIAPLAVFPHARADPEQTERWVAACAEVTHPNRQAIDGALAIALSLTGALDGLEPKANLARVAPRMKSPEVGLAIDQVRSWLADGAGPSPVAAKQAIGAGTAAAQSCPIAIYIGLGAAHRSLSDILASANAGGGDTDTIVAIAGAIWGTNTRRTRVFGKARCVPRARAQGTSIGSDLDADRMLLFPSSGPLLPGVVGRISDSASAAPRSATDHAVADENRSGDRCANPRTSPACPRCLRR